MRKFLLFFLSVTLICSTLSAHPIAFPTQVAVKFNTVLQSCKAMAFDFYVQPHDKLVHELSFLSLTGISALGTLYFASETLLDMHLRYEDIKRIYREAELELRAMQDGKRPLMSEQEIRIGAFVQALSRVPKIYWREIISTVITCGLYKTTKLCARQSFILNALIDC